MGKLTIDIDTLVDETTVNFEQPRPFMPNSRLWDLLEQGVARWGEPVELEEVLRMRAGLVKMRKILPYGFPKNKKFSNLDTYFCKIIFSSVQGIPPLPNKYAKYLPLTDEQSLQLFIESFSDDFANYVEREEENWECCGTGTDFTTTMLTHYAGINSQRLNVQVFYVRNADQPDSPEVAAFRQFVDAYNSFSDQVDDLSLTNLWFSLDRVKSQEDLIKTIKGMKLSDDEKQIITDVLTSAIDSGLDFSLVRNNTHILGGHVVCKMDLAGTTYLIDFTKRQYLVDSPVVTITRDEDFIDSEGIVYLDKTNQDRHGIAEIVQKPKELRARQMHSIIYCHQKILSS